MRGLEDPPDGPFGFISLDQPMRADHPLRISLFLLVSAIVFSSCLAVGEYKADPELARGLVNEISVSYPVSVTNDQPDSQQHPLGFRGITVNYHDLTRSLVEALKLEYRRNNVVVNDSSERVLRVAITRVGMFLDNGNFRAVLDAEVRCGDGSVKSFDATRASYGSPDMMALFPTKPLNAAFRDLVAKIMNDEDIQKYLGD